MEAFAIVAVTVLVVVLLGGWKVHLDELERQRKEAYELQREETRRHLQSRRPPLVDALKQAEDNVRSAMEPLLSEESRMAARDDGDGGLNKRPRNMCLQCGTTWSPRGQDRSDTCTACSSPLVVFASPQAHATRGQTLAALNAHTAAVVALAKLDRDIQNV